MTKYPHRHESKQDDIESDLIRERYERFIRFLRAEGQTNSECRLLLHAVGQNGWCMDEIGEMCTDRNDSLHYGYPWWVWLAREWREGVGEDWDKFPDYHEEDYK